MDKALQGYIDKLNSIKLQRNVRGRFLPDLGEDRRRDWKLSGLLLMLCVT